MNCKTMLAIAAAALALAAGAPIAQAFNPQPDPPKVKSKFDAGQGAKGIIIIGTQPGGQSNKALLPAVKPPKRK